MSVSLMVWLKRPVALAEIETSASTALRELLNLDQGPMISARFDMAWRTGESSAQLLSENSKRVICSVAGHEEEVTIMPFRVPVQVTTTDGSYVFEDRNMADIRWYFQRTSLCYTLSAGITLGLARKLDSEIIDSAGFFTMSDELSPDEFCRVLSLSTSQIDVKSAASEFYTRMSKSIQLSEQWRKQMHM